MGESDALQRFNPHRLYIRAQGSNMAMNNYENLVDRSVRIAMTKLTRMERGKGTYLNPDTESTCVPSGSCQASSGGGKPCAAQATRAPELFENNSRGGGSIRNTGPCSWPSPPEHSIKFLFIYLIVSTPQPSSQSRQDRLDVSYTLNYER